MLAKSFVGEKKIRLFQQFVSQLTRTLGYVRELLHAGFGLGCVASLANIRVIHNQGNTGREREGEGIVSQNVTVPVINHLARFEDATAT